MRERGGGQADLLDKSGSGCWQMGSICSDESLEVVMLRLSVLRHR